MPFFRFLFALLGFVTLSACGGAVGIVNSLTDSDKVTMKGDIAYGPRPRNRMDVYRPADAAANAPVILFLYGGSWSSGDRATYRFVGNALADEGFVVAIADYRVYPDTRFPGFVDDAAKALAYTHRTVAQGRPVFVVGHSAGAQIGALLALDGNYLRGEGLSPCGAIAGFVGIAGPYDFLPLTSERYRRIFPEDMLADSQPINFTTGRKPPSLLLHGGSDRTVEAQDSLDLAEALQASGNRSQARIYPRVGHINIVGAISVPFRGSAPTLADIVRFVRETGSQPGC
ncbi:alpha/beta hydrolase [Aliihoeflea sp. PC F10.4]